MPVKTSRFDVRFPLTQEQRAAELERLKLKTKLVGECWVWQGHGNKHGYGMQVFQNQPWMVHRLFYVLARGALLPGQFVLHRCDVRGCCNPDHHFLGDQTVNLHDMCAKGRHWRAKADSCRAGHKYEPGTFRVTKTGKRSCNACMRINQRIYAGWPRELAIATPVIPHGYDRNGDLVISSMRNSKVRKPSAQPIPGSQ